MSELTAKTIVELREGFVGGEFTAREIAEAYNGAVAAAKTLNAYTVETPEDALAAADAADKARGNGELPTLAGIPLGIKDLFATKGVDTTAGSRILKNFKPTYESTVSSNLRKAGAGMLGKLNMDGLVERDQRLWAGDQSLAPQGEQCRPDSRRFVGRIGGGRGSGDRGGRDWDRHGRLYPPAGGFRGDLRDQADLRALLAVGHRGVRQLARPGWGDGQDGSRLRDPARGDDGVRP